jgi:3-oxoacyl-[acyl-carrier-protein] synthase III
VSKILGMGYCLPERRVDNDELVKQLGGGAAVESAVGGSGVRARHYAADGTGPSGLAKAAAEIALREAGLGPADVEFLIFATMTPDVTFPGAGCYLQDKLGCATIGALDIRAQCAGFLFALDVAQQFLGAGVYRRILLAAADVHSAGLDFSPSAAPVTALFGDGAAAFVLDADDSGVIASVIHTDATDLERFWCEFPSSRRRPARFLPEDLRLGKHYPSIDLAFVERDGRTRMRSAVHEVLEKAAIRSEDVRRYFFQHVVRRTALAVADDLGVGDRATVGGLDEGHVASASLPMALCRAREQGEVERGDVICLATAGAGMNWGAALLRL